MLSLFLIIPKADGGKKLAHGTSLDINYYNMPTKHAEMDILNKIKGYKNLPRQIDILVIRFGQDGSLKESRPCSHCISSLSRSKLNIRYIYYSTKQNIIVREKFSSLQNHSNLYITYGIRHGKKI